MRMGHYPGTGVFGRGRKRRFGRRDPDTQGRRPHEDRGRDHCYLTTKEHHILPEPPEAARGLEVLSLEP